MLRSTMINKLSKLSTTISERISKAATEEEALDAAIAGAIEEREVIKEDACKLGTDSAVAETAQDSLKNSRYGHLCF